MHKIIILTSSYCKRARNSQSVIFPMIFDVIELPFCGQIILNRFASHGLNAAVLFAIGHRAL